ncbi:hypothetical protein ACGF12_32340 [Kitasatospora sp. NPDC048296]|uniref:hypothetical protein n=1 Tax=Kitasatospora sp. NPDC048296 TaxID=3364048 RepID=UPI003710D6B6
MTTVGYLYPWDVEGDPDAVDRVRAVGTDAIALAAAYHSTRAATPLHPAHRLVNAEHAALYLPVRQKAWRGRGLVPRQPHWMRAADPYGRARDLLRGLPVHAWTVVTHNSALGRAHPQLTVRNAFGDAYEYALCPAAEQVAEYAETLVGEVVALAQSEGVVLEACGPLGVDHGGHHDKTEFAQWTPLQRQLLSLCFCRACRARHAAAGLDSAELAARVRAACSPGAPLHQDVTEVLGEQADAVRAERTALTAGFRRRAIAAARTTQPGVRITVHASPDPWATGAFSTVADDAGPAADALVGTCWDGIDAGAATVAALRERAVPGTGIGGYLRHDRLGPAPAAATAGRLAAAGATELHLYHLGLAGTEGLAALTALTTTARNLRVEPSAD